MSSPFPGMNPYLEDPDLWPDFHGSFLIELRSRLNLILPKAYVARWDRTVWVLEDYQARLRGNPDVFVSEPKPFVKIIDGHRRRVVTVIEMLTPPNKSSETDGDAYRAKRCEYLQTGTNLVEIDLLRGGQRAPVEGEVAPCDYCILVSRAADFPRAGFWRLTIRDPLPTIPIPLEPGVGDVSIALQACLGPVYEQGRYEEDIDYTELAPPPALSAADAEWVRERVKQAMGSNGRPV